MKDEWMRFCLFFFFSPNVFVLTGVDISRRMAKIGKTLKIYHDRKTA